MANPTYSTGTVSVAANGTTVTGVGTIWSGVNAKAGDWIRIGTFQPVQIKDVTDTTHLTLWAAWPNGALSGVGYTIIQNYPARVVGVAAAEDVGDMLAALKTNGFFFFVDVGEPAPDPSYGADGQYAFQPSTGKYWLKTGGAWAVTASPFGLQPAANLSDLSNVATARANLKVAISDDTYGTTQDFNNFTKSGRYIFTTGTNTNAPENLPWYMTVDGYAANGYAKQTITAVNISPPKVYTRVCVAGTWSAWVASVDVSAFAPQGRLTLTSGTAVTTADVTGATSIYFTPAGGNQVPIFDGRVMVPTTFSELILALDATNTDAGYHQSGKNFDLFVVNDSGTIRLGTGPAWTSDTARGSGGGSTELDFSKFAVPTNKNTMTLRFGSATGNTVSIAANKATYVGSFRATANGQATDSSALRLLFNAYNQTLRAVRVSDAAFSWTYSTASWRQVNGNASNKIDILDGLGGVAVNVTSMVFGNSSTSTIRTVRSGIGLDSTTNLATGATGTVAGVSNLGATPMYSFFAVAPGLGKHSITWLEYGAGSDTQTWFGTDTAGNFMSGLLGTTVL